MSTSAKPVLAFITVLALAATAGAEKVTLHSHNNEGTIILETTVGPDGKVLATMDLTISGSHFHYTSLFLPSGMPIERTIKGGRSGRNEISTQETFGAKSAQILLLLAGKKSSLDLPYTKGESPREPHALWFIKNRPKVGEADSYLFFNLQTKQWELRGSKYVGDENVNYHGKTTKAHKVVERDNTSWVDDKGLPYILDFTEMKTRFYRD